MAAANFSRCLTRVLVHEGGYSNHPSDPGGVTLEGVIQRVYDGYRARKGKPRRALVRGMRGTAEWIAERNEIYRQNYWDVVRGDELPVGLDLVVFDGAVNSGPVQSVKWLQRALRMGQVDGHLGAATLAAINNHENHDALIADICARRMAFLRALRTWSVFGKGWASRVNDIKRVGQAWSETAGNAAPAAPERPTGDAKALPSDLPKGNAGPAAGVTGTGTVATGVLDQIQDATNQLTPLADAIRIVKYVVLALTLVAAGIMFYRIYRTWKVDQVKEAEAV